MSKAADSLLEIARVLKSNGTDGELLVSFRDIDPDDLNLQEPVFIEFDGLPVPFFIDSFRRRGNSRALVRLTDIENFEDAAELEGRRIFSKSGNVGDGQYEEGDFSFLEGWALYNDDEKVGLIGAFNDIPGNPCLEVETEKGAVMIPLHEDFILEIDEENDALYMSLPDGLFNLQ